jgi:hypothetical protein
MKSVDPTRSPLLRLKVWWRRTALTRELATGADPDASFEHMLVAGELIGRPARWRLAAGLDRVLTNAQRTPRPGDARVPLNRPAVLRARDELGALAERLRAGTPAAVQGVAIVAVLLRDASSPLYYRHAGDSVLQIAERARLRLDAPIA